jgi:hypothetical protein
MKRNKDMRYNRILVHATSVLATIPILVLFAWAAYMTGRHIWLPAGWLGGAAIIAVTVWIAARGRIMGPIAALFIFLFGGMVLLGLLSPVLKDDDFNRRIVLEIDQWNAPGLDVYCNGVHLGQTPLEITREELLAKVPPLETPPAQDFIDLSDWNENENLWHSNYTHVPLVWENTFDDPTTDRDLDEIAFIRSNVDHSRTTDGEVNQIFDESKYWFELRIGDCPVLCGISGSTGASGGSPREYSYSLTFNASYNSLPKQYAVLTVGLEAADFQPNETWCDHVLQYESVLQPGKAFSVDSDHRMQPVMEALIKRKYGLTPNADQATIDRVWDEIIGQAEKTGRFAIPSLESWTVEMLVEQTTSRELTEMYKEASGYTSASSGRSSSDDLTVFRRHGRAARLLPLEHAVKQDPSPELFEWLVYQYAIRGAGIDKSLLYYPNEEVDQLIRQEMTGQGPGGGLAQQVGSHATNWRFQEYASVPRPSMEYEYRQFITDKMNTHDAQTFSRVFVENRINNKEIDQEELAAWIYHFSPLNVQEKATLIGWIQHSTANHYVRMFDDQLIRDIVQQTRWTPNPCLESLVIEHWRETVANSLQDYVSYHHATRSLVLLDTPTAIEFLVDLLRSEDDRVSLLEPIHDSFFDEFRDYSHLDPLCDELTLIEEPSLVRGASAMLEAIGTDQAKEILAEWAKDLANDSRSTAAKEALDRIAAHEEEQRELVRLCDDLITGRITPADLVEIEGPWIWDGEQYVFESE